MSDRAEQRGCGADGRGAARAFTIVELLVSIIVIGILVALLIVSVRATVRQTRGVADSQAAGAVRLALEQFRQEYGFVPPLVKDDGDPRAGSTDPLTSSGVLLVYDVSDGTDSEVLRNRPARDPDRRYSVYALSYYLVGSLPASLDGVEGPGFRTPNRDGTFRLSDRATSEPKIDMGKGAFSVEPDPDAKTNGRYELRDRRGTPIRYYRWLTGREKTAGNFVVEGPDDLNVPAMVGDATADARLRDAQCAIVAAGDNGVFGDEPIATIRQRLSLSDGVPEPQARDQAKSDNIVEVVK